MRKLKAITLTATLLLLGSLSSLMAQQQTKPLTEKDMSAYLLVYFKDNDQSLHMAVSNDGYTFTDVNNGKPVIAGDTIATQKGIRDPHIIRGKGGAFYMCMTDLHLFGKKMGYRTTQWERPAAKYGWGNNRGFVLMKSYDLIHWTHTNLIIQKEFPGLNVGCAWAPETIYDPAANKMMLYFTMRIGNGKTKLYYAYTDDNYTHLVTRPKILFQYPDSNVQVLDADISHMPNGKYCLMYVAQTGKSGVKMATSDKINSGYVYQKRFIDFEPRACEAPNVWKRIGEKKWVVMYDVFSIHPNNFGFCETSDFKTFHNLGHFNDGVMKTTNFSSPKHGAVMQITKQEEERLINYWAKK